MLVKSCRGQGDGSVGKVPAVRAGTHAKLPCGRSMCNLSAGLGVVWRQREDDTFTCSIIFRVLFQSLHCHPLTSIPERHSPGFSPLFHRCGNYLPSGHLLGYEASCWGEPTLESRENVQDNFLPFLSSLTFQTQPVASLGCWSLQQSITGGE